MSRVKERKRFPSGDTIKTCEICGNDLTGTEKRICDTCKTETTTGIRDYLRK